MVATPFDPWTALEDARRHVAGGSAVVQVKLAAGLVAYPTGRSAMVWYGAGDAREVLDGMGRYTGDGYRVRLRFGEDSAQEAKALLRRFRDRFGAWPRDNVEPAS